MGLLESLQNLFDLEINIANKDITNVNISGEGNENPVSLSDDEEELVIDLETIGEEKREDVLDLVREEGFQKQGRVFKDSSEKDLRGIQKNEDNTRIEETLKYFRPKISDKHMRILESALYLREAWEQDRDISQKKQDIVEKYGPEGRSIANLCTAGYFDEDGYLRELYENIQKSPDYKEGEYRNLFEKVVENEPFSVFVSFHDQKDDICRNIKQKLRKYEKYGVRFKFIDVRGIGRENETAIKQSMELLEETLESIEYEEEVTEGQYLVRIDPESVQWQENP